MTQLARTFSMSTAARGDLLTYIHTSFFVFFLHQEHQSPEISGSFALDANLREDITVTLTIADENRVEYFEIKSPAGRKEIFPTYSKR